MATAAYTTVVDRAVGDPITEAIWDDQIKDNGNMLMGKASGNLLVNGGFEIWQRGAGGFTTDATYTADRWITANLAGTVTITKETTTTDTNSAAAVKIVTTGVSPGTDLLQKFEDYRQLRGKTIAFSVRVYQGVASAFRLLVEDSAASTYSSYSSATTGAWETLTVVHTVAAAATSFQVRIKQVAAAGTFYVDNAMLVIGPNACPYEPLHPQTELARCQRYYEFIGGASVSIYQRGYHSAGGTMGLTVFYKVSKGGTPTITKVGTWTVNNCAQPAVANPSSESCNINSVVTATGEAYYYTSNATDGITVEWNP